MNILITGGASGLGKAITLNLCGNADNNVYFTYNSSVKAAEEIENTVTNAKGIKCNFLIHEEMDGLLQKIAELKIDVLINNAFAGSIEKQYFHKSDTERFERDFRNNIVPVIKITRQAITGFRQKKFGKIITILSSAIINRPPVGWSDYVAGKSYLQSLSKSWAIENAAFNISSNCISPGFMQTTLTADTDERMVEEMQRNHPLKKLLSTEEVAESVNYLVNCSQQVNGTNLIINAASDLG